MNRRYRKTIIAGNWKMNLTPSKAKELFDELRPKIGKVKWCEVACLVPFVDITVALRSTRDNRIQIGAQNCHHEQSGAFTGEVSAEMLADVGVKYVVIGHSERRQYNGETDAVVNQKTHAAINAGLAPIICVGETLGERECGVTEEVVVRQVKAALHNVAAAGMRRVVFAYEPVWAIGTGKTARADEAGEICELIRTTIRKLYGARAARSVSVLYGGSMNAKNAYELLAQPHIDGGLIGGASLKAADFIAIVEAANQ